MSGCESCKFLMRQDSGYSNWTVMGTSVDCLKGLNAAMPLNDEDVESAKFDGALALGESCESRVAGVGPWFDCDGEVTNEDYADDAEVYALLKTRE